MPIIIHLFSFLNKKNLETTILLQGLITGDERIELPLKVLETSVIPFDQSPIFNFKVCTFKTTHKSSFLIANLIDESRSSRSGFLRLVKLSTD